MLTVYNVFIKRIKEKNIMPPYVFLILFAFAAVFNLIGAVKKNKIMSEITKPLLLPLLCLYCLFSSLPSPDYLLICAFALCFVGDVLLMIKGDIFFTAGGVSFFFGHVLLIIVFTRYADFKNLPLYAVIPAAALYLGMTAFIMARSRKRVPKPLFIPMTLYLVCNAVMNVFALTRLVTAPSVWSCLSYAGAVLFFLSDCVLFLCRYDDEERKRFYKNDFCVMLTYITGVLLIAVGLVPFV
jgi:uncharacterized membrane protein YhhN